MLVRQCSALSGEDVSESSKVAPVQRGIADDAPKTHLVVHPSHLPNSQLVREEVRRVLITRQALGQGHHADGHRRSRCQGQRQRQRQATTKARGQDQRQTRRRKVGHRKADCRSWQAAQNQKETEKEKEKQAGKKDAAPVKGVKKEVAAVDVGSLVRASPGPVG